MTRAASARFDRDFGDLPEGLRWREWMGRVEAAIYASPTPVSRETLARLVGDACRLDDLLADIATELKARPYEIVRVAGGFQFRTRFATPRRCGRSPGRRTRARLLSPGSKCWR
jgi:segregation and condensation protein B